MLCKICKVPNLEHLAMSLSYFLFEHIHKILIISIQFSYIIVKMSKFIEIISFIPLLNQEEKQKLIDILNDDLNTENILIDTFSHFSISASYDDTINAIKNECSNIKISYSNPGDGRIISAIKETEYLDILEKTLNKNYPDFKIIRPANRYWYDIKINDIPINLKITSGGTDNAFNKSAIIFTLTGKEIDKHNMNYNEWYDLIQHSNKKINRENRTEYHYLVVDKDTGNILLKSILDIHTYKSNPSNDLQINWKNEFDNITYQCTDFKDKIKSLLLTIQTSVKKMIDNMSLFAYANLDNII